MNPIHLGIVFVFLLCLIWLSFHFVFQKRKAKTPKPKDLDQIEPVLEVLLEGIISFNEKMEVTYANFAASQMLLISRKDLVGKSLQGPELLVEKSKALLVASLKIGSPLTDSVAFEGGKKVYLDLVALPKGKGACLVLQDKSSQQRVLEIGKDFVANASHELKTPITIIRGFAETLQDMKDLPREIVEDVLEKITRNCKRMDTLVKNLLTLADIENIPLSNCHACNIASLVEECKSALLAVYPTASLLIVKEGDPCAEVEASILELAILNLLDNAAKYSKSPAEIVVRISQKAGNVIVSISDKGAGIPAHDIDHVFERFYTVNKAHSRKLGGAGLGLSLVKKIIEKHEGTIAVASLPGEGTTFTFSVPRFRS